jgi:hypothetical protein
MVALFWGQIRGGTEPNGALVGILALPLLQWGGFMQMVSSLMFINLHVTLSTELEFMALHFSI